MSDTPPSLRDERILVVRRDNIGDLVCTAPLLRALRRQRPSAHIVVLATSYNAAVLDGNPDIDEVYSYTKAKHRSPGESLLGIYIRRLAVVRALRRKRFDWILLPGGGDASSLRFARWVCGRNVVIRNAEDRVAGAHEVEQTCHLLVRMGLHYEAPPARVEPLPEELASVDASLGALRDASRRLIGLHISARKPSQRWPAERFVELMRRVHAADGSVGFVLLWAPGTADDKAHPGDDEKAFSILGETAGMPVMPIPTTRLPQLIAVISRCDAFVCGDGGAMHIAAALGKPVVALFGQSDPARWGPWEVPHVVLQMPGGAPVDGITADRVAAALLHL